MAQIVVTNPELLVRLGRAVWEADGSTAPISGGATNIVLRKIATRWLNKGQFRPNIPPSFNPSLANVCSSLHARMQRAAPNSKDRGGYIHLLKQLGCKGLGNPKRFGHHSSLGLTYDEKQLVAKAVVATGHTGEYHLLGDWFDNIPSLCVVLREYREQPLGDSYIFDNIDDLIAKLCSGGAEPKKKSDVDLVTDFLFPPLDKLPDGRLF